MVQKQDPLYGKYICRLQEIHFTSRDTHRLKVREWKKVFHANGNQKKAVVAILIADKTDFKIKTLVRFKKKKRETLHNDQGINSRRR